MEDLEFHKIEVDREGNWEVVDYNSLKTGDRFRMFHPDGTQFIDSDKQDVLHATSEPFFDEELGAWLIHIK